MTSDAETDKTLRQWLTTEPFSLTMSSGFFSFFAHAGMLSVLLDEQLLPNRVSGSSAGALIGSLWASGCPFPQMRERLFALKKQDFWDPSVGMGLLRGELFRAILRDMMPVGRVEDCPVNLCVSCFDGFSRRTRVFESGIIEDVVYASCAVPFLFQPVWIDKRPWWDGGIRDRSGLAGIEPGTRSFFHHIPSRSPWRGKKSAALLIPQRPNMAVLAIPNLPRVGPNRLEHGPEAFRYAREATLQALDKPVTLAIPS